MHLLRWWWVAAVLVVGTITPLVAAGGGDVFGQVGVTRLGGGGGTHALVGGGVSGMIGDKAAIFGELNYVPMGTESASYDDVSVSASMRLITAGVGVRLYIPTGSSNVRLYIPAAGGLVRASGSASASLPGGSISISGTGNGGYFGFGFGSEIGEKFGIRPEFRYNRYQISGEGNNGISVSASVFYRFGGN